MISKSDYKYFKKARQAALVSEYDKFQIGCVAVYQGNIIGIGCNLNKTHPIQQHYNKYRGVSTKYPAKLHAEINCLNQIKYLDINFAKIKLYIYRVRRDQPYGIARPCPSCMAAIKDLGVRNVYYTTNDGYAYEYVEKNMVGGVA